MNPIMRALILLVFLVASQNLVAAGDYPVEGPAKPTAKEKCPVCGMFVAKYPDWIGQIVFDDGQRIFFDGAKDLFKYYFDLKKYNPEKTRKNITGIYVTEYYNLDFIDAGKAWFVIGSDVYGPMGRELIPFKTKDDAAQFMKDHSGKRIMIFKEVTPKLIKKLDD